LRLKKIENQMPRSIFKLARISHSTYEYFELEVVPKGLPPGEKESKRGVNETEKGRC
jgi:hypothetical protein